ncbi:hypothetical protein AC244_27110 [Ensifer adhaerens]|uniref:Uncharacterized protein n=1 Tax=Ensifer adhaerens TaxID=106592 RepID=A0A0L8BIX3_ENSAD|nr:hypothetical protein AC244_27110 [Ensifer adhaerens]
MPARSELLTMQLAFARSMISAGSDPSSVSSATVIVAAVASSGLPSSSTVTLTVSRPRRAPASAAT